MPFKSRKVVRPIKERRERKLPNGDVEVYYVTVNQEFLESYYTEDTSSSSDSGSYGSSE